MSYVYNLSNVIPKEKMFDGDFLESKKINRKEITGPNGITYNIYRYEKMCLTHDAADSIGLFRSVVFNKDKIVAFSPPKSHHISYFQKNNSDFEQLAVEEFVEGTMINLFYDNGEWELSTKGTVGGNSAFFKDDDKIRNPVRTYLFISKSIHHYIKKKYLIYFLSPYLNYIILNL